MSSLLEIVENRGSWPLPWEEGDNIPWHESGFSQRMLAEHLTQEHDAASRRTELIDRHVAWLYTQVLNRRSTRVLDLGCGPGLYSSRLADLGHSCVGIDYSPASIAYARQQAQESHLDCNYILGDLRHTDFGENYGLVMLIYGELNVFRPGDISLILTKMNRALNQDGILVLEPHTYEAVKQMGHAKASWSASRSGLFSDRPHILLDEDFWDARFQTATHRFYVIEAASGELTRYAQSFQAYSDEAYVSLLEEHGFGELEFFPSLTGSPETGQQDLLTIVARKVRPL
jgi:SAM-dependent methyltransferase